MVFLQIIGITLLLPFFGWAIVLLRRRFVYYVENSVALEATTLAFLALFFTLEAWILKLALGQQQTLLYFLALLGLSVAAFALYAHVLISLASRIVVDLAVPGDETAVNQPRFGPVDALERYEDYTGALQEYLVLARIYPRNFEVLRRTARVEEILGHPEEAITWYLRARKRAGNAGEALTAVNRLCALYDATPESAAEADVQLAQFLEDYPESPDRMLVLDRLERRASRSERSVSTRLEALHESPLEPAPDAPARERRPPSASGSTKRAGRLAPLEETAAPAPAPAAKKKADVPRKKVVRVPESIFLDDLGTMEVPEAAAAENPPRKPPKRNGRPVKRKSALEAMDTASPAPDETSTPPPEPKKRPRISLDAMDTDDP